MGYYRERVEGGLRLMTYLLITRCVRVYRNCHNLYFHLCVQYETVFDRRVPKIVYRCVVSLCSI